MQLNGWDLGLKVTDSGKGLIGHAGAILLRKAADVTGLTPLLGGALAERDRPGMADQPLPAVSDLQPQVPPVKLHGRRALQFRNLRWCGNP